MNILITGGASGLGEAITTTLAKDDSNKVYFTYSKSNANAKNIEAIFKNTIAIPCDFKNNDSIQLLIKNIPDLDLDVLINNAYGGRFLKTYFHKIPSTDFLTEFKENVLPVVEITQAVLSTFRKKKQGKIITILTAALANIPPIGASVYAANKAYVAQLTKVWATENAKFNITSNSVSPSFMQTNLTSNMDERTIEQIAGNHPLKKILTTQEVAETVLYLMNASSQINGVDILINAATNIK